jgi:hypothetical protein
MLHGSSAALVSHTDVAARPPHTRKAIQLSPRVSKLDVEGRGFGIRRHPSFLWLPVSREGALSLPTVEPDL